MKSKSLVSIVKGEDPIISTKKAINLLGGINKIIKKDDKILIKPNLVVPLPNETGVTTSPLVVKAIIELLKQNGNEKITVGDSPFFPFKAKDCFERTGMKEIIKDMDTEIAYFDEEEYISVENSQGKLLKEINLPKSIVNCDAIISVPKMKCHSQTKVSLSLKNQIGVLSPKDKQIFHRDDLHQKIIDCFVALRNKLKLSVMDALVSLEGQGPTYGNPVKLDLVLASQDFLALDSVSCEIMDHKLMEVAYLRLAAQEKLGEFDIGNIEILGEKIQDIKHPFIKASQELIGVYPNVHVYVGGACKIGCFAWGRVAIDSLVKKGELDKYGDISIIMGIDPHIPEKLIGTVFVIGDCAKKYQDKGIFIPGCPPFMTYKEVRENLMKK
ncbi:MAG: DUF362 domain-containing protein [Candidatus Helarchaeota archaeon]|nr:DUF362 domain-containing protein [Candidatus Helarchaeota archaeon]